MAPHRLLLLAAWLTIAPTTLAEAAVLIEARQPSGTLRIVIEGERALIATPGGQRVVDLGGSPVQASAGGASVRPAGGGAVAAGAYRVTAWGPGPVIAGHATVYHVITHGAEICAEMLVSGWMQPFLAPVAAALDTLDHPPVSGRGCAQIPFAAYAAAGWPMLAGKLDHLTFETRTIRYDYRSTAAERALLDDGWLGAIRQAIWLE